MGVKKAVKDNLEIYKQQYDRKFAGMPGSIELKEAIFDWATDIILRTVYSWKARAVELKEKKKSVEKRKEKVKIEIERTDAFGRKWIDTNTKTKRLHRKKR